MNGHQNQGSDCQHHGGKAQPTGRSARAGVWSLGQFLARASINEKKHMALEPEVRGQPPRLPSTTHVPVGKLFALSCLDLVICKMGMFLTDTIDVMPVTDQMLP